MAIELRCPMCRELDWFRDGLVVVEFDDGTVVVERVGRANGGRDDWSCTACGYEVLSRSKSAQMLDDLAMRRYSSAPR